MRRFLIAGAAIVALVGTYIAARAELSPLLGVYNADNATFYAGLQVYPSGGFGPRGKLYTTIATSPTAGGTAEQTLATYSLPAHALDIAGRRLHIHTVWHAATNSNNKTVKLYFGASVITTGTLTTSNANGMLDLTVVKSGASTQIVTGTGYVATTNITPYVNAGSDADTAAITIKMTGQDGTDSAADITLEDFFVEYLS